MPNTLFGKVIEKDHPVSISIYLPENYTADYVYPLVLFLNGGSGGSGRSTGIPRMVTGDMNYICVNFPLFISRLDSVNADSSNYWQRMFIDHKDSAIIWENYRIMLDYVWEIIPNIDTANTFMGGFSNGANTAAVLLSMEQQAVKKYFKSFFFIEGGSHLEKPEALVGAGFLWMVSGKLKRQKMLDGFEEVSETSPGAELYIMEDVGHGFPVQHYGVLLDWMEKCRSCN